MLKARSAQPRARRDELASQVAAAPTPPAAATLRQVADHIADIVASGSHSQRKGLIEVLIARIKISGPDRIIAVFRVPQPPAADKPEVSDGTATTRCAVAAGAVRAMNNLVEVAGIEPASFSTSPRLLRVQPAVLFSAPAVTQASCRRAQSL
jgi:site-specific DNA recombinase